jgi:hypothetical protein
MSTAWRDPSPAFGFGQDQAVVERYLHPRGVHSRNAFRRWLETVLRDFSEHRPANAASGGPILSNFCSRVWEFAVDCATRYCPECRKELGDAPPVSNPMTANADESRKPWDELLRRLSAAHACAANPSESDAERLANYLSNYSSRGHKSMVTELWAKGYASYSRLANLRGKYGVTPNADRNAIDRLVAKADALWVKESQIRIKKEASGLTLEKHSSSAAGGPGSDSPTQSAATDRPPA